MENISTNRLRWTNKDWAKYMNCSITEVKEYKKFLFNTFETGIAKSRETGKYRFEMYKYHISPSEFKMPLLMFSGKKEFISVDDAIKDANNIISGFELSDYWAKMYEMPKQAVQMLLIKATVR